MKNKLGVAAAIVVGAVTASGITWAAVPDSGGRITGCYVSGTGQLRVVDTESSPPQRCKTNETQLSWNIQGLAGAPGAPGATGPAGPQGVPGPQGPSGFLGIRVVSQDVTVPAHDFWSTGVGCDSHEVATGGTYANHVSSRISGQLVYATDTIAGVRAWNFEFFNTDDNPQTVTAYVTCLKVS